MAMANEWSKRSKKYDTAVIVFKLKDESVKWFSSSKGESLCDDTSAGSDWWKAVRFFRHGKNRKMDAINKPRAYNLSRCDYLFGPIADGRLRENPTPGDPVEYQLCIKTQDSAERFYNDGVNIEKVIFFTSDNPAY